MVMKGKLVWLIDRRNYWREPFARALREEGFEVLATDRYDVPSMRLVGAAGPPDLVILACTAVTSAELQLVSAAARSGYYLVVLVASLPVSMMRELFLAGAYDVAQMPVEPQEFAHMVSHTLNEADSAREHKAAALAGL